MVRTVKQYKVKGEERYDYSGIVELPVGARFYGLVTMPNSGAEYDGIGLIALIDPNEKRTERYQIKSFADGEQISEDVGEYLGCYTVKIAMNSRISTEYEIKRVFFRKKL